MNLLSVIVLIGIVSGGLATAVLPVYQLLLVYMTMLVCGFAIFFLKSWEEIGVVITALGLTGVIMAGLKFCFTH